MRVASVDGGRRTRFGTTLGCLPAVRARILRSVRVGLFGLLTWIYSPAPQIRGDLVISISNSAADPGEAEVTAFSLPTYRVDGYVEKLGNLVFG